LKKVGQIENSLIMVDAFGRGFAFEFWEQKNRAQKESRQNG
jgi:hypothetical protein